MNYSLTSTAGTHIDATNLSVTFIAPASGKVTVELCAFWEITLAPGYGVIEAALITHGGTTQPGGKRRVWQGVLSTGAATQYLDAAFVVKFPVIGLTGGNTYVWDWGAWLLAGGTATGAISADDGLTGANDSGVASMTVIQN